MESRGFRRRHWLLMGFILWFPPLHELVHVAICMYFKVSVIKIEFDKVWFESADNTAMMTAHFVWELLTVTIPMELFFLFMYYESCSLNKKRK